MRQSLRQQISIYSTLPYWNLFACTPHIWKSGGYKKNFPLAPLANPVLYPHLKIRGAAIVSPAVRGSRRSVATLPHTTPSKRTLGLYLTFLDLFGLSYSLWQLCTLTMFSALVVVYTAYSALQIVLLTLHYITLCSFEMAQWYWQQF